MPWIILGIIISYLVGSLPTAYIFCRILKGIDIRKFGSGNVGATNALRVLGLAPGLAVLFIDMLKGLIATMFVADFIVLRIAGIVSIGTLRLIMGISSICGHNWTLFLGFKGGKGIATTFGVFLALAIKIPALRLIFIILIITWAVIFLIFRIVSLASVISGICLPVYTIIFKQPRSLIFATLVISIFIIIRHKSNLQRLLQGKEPRIRF